MKNKPKTLAEIPEFDQEEYRQALSVLAKSQDGLKGLRTDIVLYASTRFFAAQWVLSRHNSLPPEFIDALTTEITKTIAEFFNRAEHN